MTETHLVLIPSYNTGDKLFETVAAARAQWPVVWVSIDGSTDGTGTKLAELTKNDPGIRILHRPRNGGKGGLVMDADGQHHPPSIVDFMNLSSRHPDAMILGVPIFDRTAPLIRVLWRRISNVLTKIEARSPIVDSLFGFRVYPLAALLTIMEQSPHMRRFDFDNEAAVRLTWSGVPAINQTTPVRYFRTEQGGVSHFRYGRDNLLLATMHIRLLRERLFYRRTEKKNRFLKKAAQKLS
jgi:glycosyltransferase involved in cell wall biosynthesis